VSHHAKHHTALRREKGTRVNRDSDCGRDLNSWAPFWRRLLHPAAGLKLNRRLIVRRRNERTRTLSTQLIKWHTMLAASARLARWSRPRKKGGQNVWRLLFAPGRIC
jgi:hypothetical protein